MQNKRLFGRICYLKRQMSRENNYIFSDYGITPIQMDTLVFVDMRNRANERVCQKDIEKHLNLRASSVSTLLRTLEKNLLIIRTVSGGDARTKFVTLTQKGECLCIKNKILMDKCDALIQSALTEQEQETFNELLNKIIAEIIGPAKEGK